jgi:hypothetical protein
MGFSGADAYDKGKRADLAFGFGGGKGAYRNYAGADDTTSDEQIERYKQTWRAQHSQVVNFWYRLDDHAIAAVRRTPEPISYGRFTLQCRQLNAVPFLFIKLPSGRELAYPFVKLIRNERGNVAISFMDNAIITGGWTEYRPGRGIWGGTFCENVVQATARDLLAAAMLRLEAAGYPVVLHVHDEIVCELPEGVGSVAEFKRLIEQLPDWAEGLPVAAKVRNGPRWAEIEAPVVHVPGASETAQPARAKAKAAKRTAPLEPIEALPLNTDMVARVAAWAIEREAIRQRKESGAPWPWTTDPILRAGSFCNVHREHDRVTRQIAAGLVQPFHNAEDLWFGVTLARCLNEPSTLSEIEKWVPFEPDYLRGILGARQARGERVFRTQAYKPPTPPNKGDNTIRFLLDDVLAPMWANRENLRPRTDDTLASYSDRLRQCYRIGPFLAGQIIADLKHVAPLCNAADWWSFAVPGPGSERGLNRVCGRALNAAWPEARWLATLLRLREETAPALAAAKIAPLDAQNMQNVLCETDKYFRAGEKGGAPSRQYKPSGVAPAAKPKVPKAKPAPATAPILAVLAASEAPDTASFTGTAPALVPDEAAQLLDQMAADYVAPTVVPFPATQIVRVFLASTRPATPLPRGGSQTATDDDSFAQDHAGEPFDDSSLLRRGYACTRTFDYTLPDGTVLYEQRRYELHPTIPAIKGRPRKRFLPRYSANGVWLTGAGPRLVPYNWPALVPGGPGATVFIPEGEGKVDALSAAGWLATTVVSHKWSPESVAALTGMHAIILADHDEQGATLAEAARAKLAPIAASIRVVPYLHLWQALAGGYARRCAGRGRGYCRLAGQRR